MYESKNVIPIKQYEHGLTYAEEELKLRNMLEETGYVSTVNDFSEEVRPQTFVTAMESEVVSDFDLEQEKLFLEKERVEEFAERLERKEYEIPNRGIMYNAGLEFLTETSGEKQDKKKFLDYSYNAGNGLMMASVGGLISSRLFREHRTFLVAASVGVGATGYLVADTANDLRKGYERGLEIEEMEAEVERYVDEIGDWDLILED